jgi:hypothetical protein
MKFPSVHYLLGNVLVTVRRFPFECLFALIGTWAAVGLFSNYVDQYISNDWYTRLFMMAVMKIKVRLKGLISVICFPSKCWR